MYATIQRWGNSQAVRLPKPILETASFKENEKVQIIAGEGHIIIKKAAASNYKPLAERLKDFDGNYQFEEWDTGKPVGKEVW